MMNTLRFRSTYHCDFIIYTKTLYTCLTLEQYSLKYYTEIIYQLLKKAEQNKLPIE